MQETGANLLKDAQWLIQDAHRLLGMGWTLGWATLKRLGLVLPPVEQWPWRVLGAPGIMIVLHYVLYGIIKWFRLTLNPKTIDRLLWFSVSAGCAAAWTFMLYPVLPWGMVPLNEDVEFKGSLTQALVSSYIVSWAVMCVYYWITALTSGASAASPGFYIRKLIPVVAVIVFPFALPKALGPLDETLLNNSIAISGRQLLVGWLIRYGILDALVDLAFVTYSSGLRSILAGLWCILLWQVYGVYHLFTTTVLGQIPCYCIIVPGLYVLVFELSPLALLSEEQSGR